MTPQQAADFLTLMKKEARPVAGIALNAAAQAFNLRAEFLKRQPHARQAEWMRKSLGRTVAAPVAEELLATYFLEHQKPLLVELLDALGVPHEDGQLESPDPECPPEEKLREIVAGFRKGEGPERRHLLLQAFAAQSGVNWPALETLLLETPGTA